MAYKVFRGGGRSAWRNTDDSHALVDTLADSLTEVDVETLADALSDAYALVESLADTVAQVDVETLGDKVSDAHALVKSLADMVGEVAA